MIYRRRESGSSVITSARYPASTHFCSYVNPVTILFIYHALIPVLSKYTDIQCRLWWR